jgi:hypothetical protein
MSQFTRLGSGGGGSITVPVTVPNGGTGQITLPAHSVLLGNGTSAIGNVGPGAANTILMGTGAGSDPVFGSLVAGSNITITPGVGTLTISSSGGGGAGNIVFTGDTGSTATTNAGAINIFGDVASGSSVLGNGAQTITVANLAATTAQKGVVQLATNAQAIAGLDTAAALTSDDLKAKLGTQSSNGIPYGQGTSSALAWTAPGAANTVLLGNGGVPSFGAVPNAALTNSSVTLNSGNNITVTGGAPLSLGGTASFNVTGTTNHAVLLGNATGSINSAATGTNGQVLIGSTGADPGFGTLSSGDGSITFTTGAGTLALSVTSGTTVGKTITGDTGGALLPTAGNWNIVGNSTQGVSTSGAASTLTVTVASATTVQKGVVSLATNAEAIAGTDTAKVLTADDLKAKLGAQTPNGVAFGVGTTSALGFTAAGTTGQVLIATTGSAPTWGTAPASAGTITGDSGGALSQTASNWNILGQKAGTIAVMDTVGSVSTLSIENRTWLTQLVVDPSSTVGLRGTYTTVTAALADAISGQTILIRPGDYAENITAKDGVSLWGAYQGGVNLRGKITMTSGVFTIRNINVINSADTCLAVSAGTLYVIHCAVFVTGASPAITLTGTGAVSAELSTIATFAAGATNFNIGAGAILYLTNCSTGGSDSATADTVTGSLSVSECILFHPINISGSGYISLDYVRYQIPSATALTFTGTSTADIWFTNFNCGTSSCISVGAGCDIRINNCDMQSTNTNAITGAGEVRYAGLSYYYTTLPNKINVTSQFGQPAFSAYSTGMTNFTGDGTVATVTFDTELYDQCKNFASNTFTCLEPGKYIFQVCVTLSGVTSSHTLGELKIVTTGNSFMMSHCNPNNVRDVSGIMTMTGTCTVYMAYAETAHVTCQLSNGSKVVDMNGSLVNSYFTGYKLSY